MFFLNSFDSISHAREERSTQTRRVCWTVYSCSVHTHTQTSVVLYRSCRRGAVLSDSLVASYMCWSIIAHTTHTHRVLCVCLFVSYIFHWKRRRTKRVRKWGSSNNNNNKTKEIYIREYTYRDEYKPNAKEIPCTYFSRYPEWAMMLQTFSSSKWFLCGNTKVV